MMAKKSFNDEIRFVSNWFIDNHLFVNPEKCSHTKFGRKPDNVKTSTAHQRLVRANILV